MANETPIFSYQEADYLNLGTSETPDWKLMKFFTTFDESPNAQVVDKAYVSEKNASTITTGYQTQFPITLDQYLDNEVCEAIRDVAEEQKLGVMWELAKVRLYQPVTGEGTNTTTFFARKFNVTPAIDTVSRAASGIIAVEGNLNTIGSVAIGAFDVEALTFTATV